MKKSILLFENESSGVAVRLMDRSNALWPILLQRSAVREACDESRKLTWTKTAP
jgi:hypothetical protein